MLLVSKGFRQGNLLIPMPKTTQVVLSVDIIYKYTKYKILTLDRGSLGSWVDEDRSKLRVAMWTAGHMIIDMLNAYCALYIWF
jgi:hypothetical protein